VHVVERNGEFQRNDKSLETSRVNFKNKRLNISLDGGEKILNDPLLTKRKGYEPGLESKVLSSVVIVGFMGVIWAVLISEFPVNTSGLYKVLKTVLDTLTHRLKKS